MKVDGGELNWSGPEFLFTAGKVTEEAMTKACIYTQGEAKKLVGGRGFGRAYKRGKKKHHASLPGQPPARDTGTLASSIEYKIETRGNMVYGKVGSDLDLVKREFARRGGSSGTTQPDYGSYLEFGTRRMAARPWLAPTLRNVTAKITRIFQNALKG